MARIQILKINWLTGSILITLALSMATRLTADPNGLEPRERPLGEGRPSRPIPSPEDAFSRIDVNQDGEISKKEFIAAFQRRTQRKGRPPQRPGEERGHPPKPGQSFGRPGFPPPPLLLALDTDRDGRISSDEIKNAAVSLRSLDRNGDGDLTREELRPRSPRPDHPARPRPPGSTSK